MQTVDLIITLVELLLGVGLFWLAGFSQKVMNTKWKLCYLIPLVVTIFVLMVGGFEISMLPAYLAGLFCLLGFFKEDLSSRKMAAIITFALALLCTATTDYYPGYREKDYVGNFKLAYKTLQEHYVLADHKDIDWDALYDEYIVKFEDAKKQHDEILYAVAFKQFVNEFHDGHVSYATTQELEDEVFDAMAGNDYGFSLMRLDDGSFVAVNVEDRCAASNAGIHNGTEIVSWNGETIDEVCERADMSWLASMPLKENEDFYRPMVAAGIGEDSISISFIDDAGKKQTVDVTKLGSYRGRLQSTLDIVDQGVNISNLSFKEINPETYVLRIKEMQYDSESYVNGDHSVMQSELRDKLIELKGKNVNHLVIDIRSNGGGSPHMIMAIAALFAPEGEHEYAYEGVFDKKTVAYEKDENGKYKVGAALKFTGENVWENRKVTILVNAQSISAADHFSYLMRSLNMDNVKVVGYTQSNSSGQAISGVPLENEVVTYSCVPTLDRDGNILIDPDASRAGGVEIDEKVPFTKDIVKALFDDGQDYLLNYVVGK